MKKVFKLQDLDCANCAAKMEQGINNIDGVSSASVNFMSQKLIIDAEESSFDKIMKQVKKVMRKVEPGCMILE
ncbi:MAG: cation transporter [Christensenellaceae bacterium]|jgi:copper chaperone CopZ